MGTELRRHYGLALIIGLWLLLMLAGRAEGLVLENWFWLHHSVGRNIIAEGDMRGMIEDYNLAGGTAIEFWDHDYNHIGLTYPDGIIRPPSYSIPSDANTPEEFHVLWTTENSARDSILNNHQLIAFKPGFLSCEIPSATDLFKYKMYYLAIRDQFDIYASTYPDRLFIVMSPTPLHWRATNSAEADRARAFSNWLASDAFLAGHPNIRTFDIFDILAHPDDGSDLRNTLHLDYTNPDLWFDSHPTPAGSIACALALFDFLIDVAIDYSGLDEPPSVQALRLLPVRPNPFNAAVGIPFQITTPGPMTLSVHDLAGHHLQTLIDTPWQLESGTAIWNGRDRSGRTVASGTYIFRLETDKGVRTRKAVLAK